MRAAWGAIAVVACLAGARPAAGTAAPTPASPDLVTVQVVNALSGQPLAGLKVIAKQRNGTVYARVGSATTDATGRAAFKLTGVSTGVHFAFSATPYNGGTVQSADVAQPGPFRFAVGTLPVTVVAGGTGAPLNTTKVTLREQLADGTFNTTASGTTGANGSIVFDPPGLGAGRVYVLETKSPVDGSTKRSGTVTAIGPYTFTVGNAPLNVTLINGLSGQPLAQVAITARELLATGQTAAVRGLTTDAGGRATFDLDGLGGGRRYVLTAKPYAPGTVTSDAIDQPGNVYFRVGTVPVTMFDADNNVPLAGQKIMAYEKLPDGSRALLAQGTTDATGTVAFDLPGVSQTIARQQPPAARASSRVYAFRAGNPFGNNKEYWSQPVVQEGPVTMRLQRAVGQPLDVTPPTVGLSSPANGATVSATGFSLLGTASDNVRLDHVTVTASDPLRGTSQVTASYDAVHGQWSAALSATMISVNQTVAVTVVAYDTALNRSTVAASFNVRGDMTPPQVTITRPQVGTSAPSSGFMVSGLASDDIGVVGLVATVDDPVLGRTVNQTLGVAPDGRWSFAVLSGQVSQGQAATITLVAQDATGKQGRAALSVPITGADVLAHHVLNRTTFGSTPDLLAQVQSMGVDAFIDQQLNPQSIDDSALAMLLGAAPTTTAELQRQTLLRMIYSRRQLLEVLTEFWDNHFNTDITKDQSVAYEFNENMQFRQLAFGRFRDLLGASARSPAMLIFLDQASSESGTPNENYAREVMELHTMSVDGGYTQTDVEQVARAFTGWTVHKGQFFFDAANHDGGQKVVLGQTLAAGRGIEDGEQVLDILASHPSTAHFICTKLSQLLVSDAPPASLVNPCADQFLATGGQIGAVVDFILHAPEFVDPAAFRAKVRTPVEMAVFWVRALNATSDARGLITPLSDMGMPLFENDIPTGWSELGDDWINSNLLLQRIRYATQLVRNQIPGTTVDLPSFFTRYGKTTAEGIAGFLLEQLFQSNVTPLDYGTAMGILTDGGTRPFSLSQADAESRLQQMVGTVLGSPEGQYQ